MRSLQLAVLILAISPGLTFGQAWDPEDTTFDPDIRSVVIGDRTWLGDPCPFVYPPLSRTGYTYVAKTQFKGFPPSVQISLIVPVKPGEVMPASGMLMMNKEQTSQLLQKLEAAVTQLETNKNAAGKTPAFPATIATAMGHVEWTLTTTSVDGKQRAQFESKTKGKTESYQFSVNATKKLISAVKHALSQIKEPTDQ